MEINLWIKSPFSLETISRFLPLKLIPKYFTGKKSLKHHIYTFL